MRPLNVRRCGAALTAALLALVALPAHGAPAVALPTADPFYSYTGATPLADIKAGTVLKTRSITVSLAGNATPLPADQLLYRTAGETGQPTVTVTTLITSPSAPVVPKIVSYQSFYDALGAQCDPSYTLAGGDPGQANRQNAYIEQGLISEFVAAGYTVNVPDFEGEDLHWSAGHESAYGTLDSLRAAEAHLGAPASTPVGLFGYSGGSIASEWASEMAPTYAPELNIVGVAEGGIPVDYAHNLTYISGSPSWSAIMPGILLALSRAYGFDLTQYLSPYGVKLVNEARGQCINTLGPYPGLTYQQLLKPQYQNPFLIPDFVRVINGLTMGTAPGHPTGPLLMAVGNADGTGDGVMIAKDVEALAHEYCAEGVPLELHEFNNLAHTQAAVPWDALAIPFLEDRLNGVPFVDQCASVPVGNSLALLPTPPTSAQPVGTVVTLRITNELGGHGATIRVDRAKDVALSVRLRFGRGVKGGASLAKRVISLRVDGKQRARLVTGSGGGVVFRGLHLSKGTHVVRAVFAGAPGLDDSASHPLTVRAL